jgi:superfamily I DNA and/or RNA helicase
MLDTQYRMHPSISEFSSKTFYNCALKDGTVTDGVVRAGLDPPKTSFLLDDEESGKPLNVTFLNHDYPESPASRSIANYHEAGRVCDIVADLLHNNPVSPSQAKN